MVILKFSIKWTKEYSEPTQTIQMTEAMHRKNQIANLRSDYISYVESEFGNSEANIRQSEIDNVYLYDLTKPRNTHTDDNSAYF